MYQNERKNEIIKLLSSEGYLTTRQLSKLLYASESSIRRDLTALEKQGVLSRSYGGAELVKNRSLIVPFSSRAHHNISAKKIMAKKAVRLIHDGDILFLDQSSSSFFVAYELLHMTNLTVITNNVEILSLLSQSSLEVLSSGGRLSKANRNCLLGTDAHNIFAELHADLFFFSTKALSSEGIIYDCDREEVCIRNAMRTHAAQTVFLCSSDKFDHHSGYRQCSLDDVDHLVSELDRIDSLEAFRNYQNIYL